MAKSTLTATTPFGDFSRKTDSPYTHVVVRSPDCNWREVHSPEELVAKFGSGHGKGGGVFGRYVKDRGYIVSWHSSASAAISAKPAGYCDSKLLGVFPVNV